MRPSRIINKIDTKIKPINPTKIVNPKIIVSEKSLND